MPSPRGTWWTLGQAENPLCRIVDRNHHRTVLALVLAAALLVPALCWATGSSTYRWNTRVERAEQAARHQVPAVMLDDAALHSNGRPSAVVTLAPASWRAPDGRQRSGQIATRPGTPAGTTQQLWVDRSGAPVGAPQTRGQTMVALLVTIFLTALITGSLLASAGCLLGRRFDRQRYAMWEAGWARMDEQRPV